MSLIEEIEKLGANVEEAMARFMDNSALYERMLKRLPDATEKAQVKAAFDAKDYDAAEKGAHALKGVAGNLALDALYEGYSKIVELLREGKPAEASELLEKTLELKRPIVECVKKYL